MITKEGWKIGYMYQDEPNPGYPDEGGEAMRDLEDIYIEKGCKVGIVCCSNGQAPIYKNKIDRLEDQLLQLGVIPIFAVIFMKMVPSSVVRQRSGPRV